MENVVAVDFLVKNPRARRFRVMFLAIVFLAIIPLSIPLLKGLSKNPLASKPPYAQRQPDHAASAKTQSPAQNPPTKVALATNNSTSHKSGGGLSSRATTAIPAVPACKAADIPVPTPAVLTAAVSGLQQQIEAPQYYQVYGYTAADVQRQLFNCSPFSDKDGKFAASTNYSINWRVSYVGDEQGQCKISSAVVGVHVAQIMPHWNDSSYAMPGYAGRWQTFVNNLQTHEDGHRDLYLAYAAQLLQDLQALPTNNCENFMSYANSRANADLSQLRQADEAYDQRTNHGASQGAVIPAQ